MREFAVAMRAAGWRLVLVVLNPLAPDSLRPAVHVGHVTRGAGMSTWVVTLDDTDADKWLFGWPEAQDAVARILIEEGVDVVHHIWGPQCVLPELLLRSWLMGLPSVISVLDDWGSQAHALLDAHLAEAASYADVLAASTPEQAQRLASLAWSSRSKSRLCLPMARKAVEDWAAIYRLLVGDLEPPVTDQVVSVVITTYNRPDALRRCLQHLTRQTLCHDNMEIIVVDDAGTTPVHDVVDEFSGELPVQLHVHPTNRGLGSARNTGVDAASGWLVLFLDDDNEPGPRYLAEHLRSHLSQPAEHVAVLGFTGLAAETPLDLNTRHIYTIGQEYLGFRALLHDGVYDWTMFWGGCSSLKRSLFRYGRFETRFLEDTDLAYRLADAGLVVLYNRQAVQVVSDLLGYEAMCRRSSRMGEARAYFVQRHADPLLPGRMGIPNAREHFETFHRATALSHDLLESLRTCDLSYLRRTPSPDDPATSLLAAADRALGLVYASHWRLGLLTPLVRGHARRNGGVQIGVGADNPRLDDIVLAYVELGAPDGCLVVGAHPTELEAVAEHLAALLTAAGHDPDRIADIEVVPAAGRPGVDLAVHFALESAGLAGWTADDPLPLPQAENDIAVSLRRALLDEELVGALR